ncbi:GDYXXLXY domain-containing protein [Skermanella rosea]|uniref:GDYXXLXY domain-containing protein n=1 Tax=Skermanella rosea TaxID=1817965 RepID=UPI00193406B6|nr:GDYXXLXY domain-containing protein [Skermanella rosea]UEM02882.1 GDYXXLXY domain-containing protein [Skermanella rosea]
MTRGGRLLTLALAQTAVLAGLIGFRQWTLETGTPVVLSIRPVDPRSLFQGDYVEFSYDIGHLRLDRLVGDDDLERGETVYVDIQPGRPAWQATGVWRQRPAATPTGAVLRGQVRWVTEQQCEESGSGESAAIVPCRIAAIRYGIEEYFVPEGTGSTLERPAEGERIDIRVAVNRAGTPAISAILVNGEVRHEEGLF